MKNWEWEEDVYGFLVKLWLTSWVLAGCFMLTAAVFDHDQQAALVGVGLSCLSLGYGGSWLFHSVTKRGMSEYQVALLPARRRQRLERIKSAYYRTIPAQAILAWMLWSVILIASCIAAAVLELTGQPITLGLIAVALAAIFFGLSCRELGWRRSKQIVPRPHFAPVTIPAQLQPRPAFFDQDNIAPELDLTGSLVLEGVS